MTDINVKKLNDFAKLPTRGSEYAAGVDLYAAIDRPIWVAPHSTVKIGTGLAFELPEGVFAAIFARSGVATKRGLRPANCVGVIDSDYRGQVIVALHNDTQYDRDIVPGERIAQMVLLPFISMDFNEVNELSDTARGEGGFGDSGRF